MTNDWKTRHDTAWRVPNRTETPIVNMIRAVDAYITWQEVQYGTPWRDWVLGPGVGDLLEGIRTLLNGDLGRLDGGTLDAMLVDLAIRTGYDLNTQRMVGDE
jgi:hypothetical protein